MHVRAWDNGGTSSDNTFGPLLFDSIPPDVNCGSPDGIWHANNVSIHCTASDSLSGLNNPSDASFNLTTNVAAGTFNANAFTNSRVVFDVAGNSTTAGPIGGNMVDRQPPTIVITSPTAAIPYLQSDTLTLAYSVTDGGSGVAAVIATIDGNTKVGGVTLSNGATIQLLNLAIGPHTFTINAADNVGNTSSASVTFNIALALGQCSVFPVTLPAPAGPSGQTVSVTIGNTAVASLNPSGASVSLSIPAGQTMPSPRQALVCAVNFGTTSVTISGMGITTIVEPLIVTSSLTFAPPTMTLSASGRTGRATLSLTGATPANLTINLTSDTPGVATVPATVVIPAGSASVTVPVTSVAAGSAKIAATNAAHGLSASLPVTVMP